MTFRPLLNALGALLLSATLLPAAQAQDRIKFKAIGQPLNIEEINDPVPAADEVVVEVGRCGICGSDLHMTEDPLFGVTAETVLGHEFAGEVVGAGAGVKNLKTGDRVTISPLRVDI